MEYLGYIINVGLLEDPDKITSIFEYPIPSNVKELRRFLGMASSYTRFIPEFLTIVAPLNLLLRKKQHWLWADEHNIAFKQIKSSLVSVPILSCPNFIVLFELQTLASTSSIGAVLTQKIDGIENIISYASRSLLSAE